MSGCDDFVPGEPPIDMRRRDMSKLEAERNQLRLENILLKSVMLPLAEERYKLADALVATILLNPCKHFFTVMLMRLRGTFPYEELRKKVAEAEASSRPKVTQSQTEEFRKAAKGTEGAKFFGNDEDRFP